MKSLPKKHLIYLLFALALLLLPTFLYSESPATAQEFQADSAQTTVVQFNDMRITVKPGSANEEMSVKLGAAVDYAGLRTPRLFQAISNPYLFGPDGLALTENTMLHVSIKIRPEMIPQGYRPDQVKLFSINKEAGQLEPVVLQFYDEKAGTLEADLIHLKGYVPGVMPGWDGEGIAPYTDFISNGEETVNISGLNVAVNVPIYSLPGRGMETYFGMRFTKNNMGSPFTISRNWVWDMLYYTDGRLNIPGGGSYEVSTLHWGDGPVFYKFGGTVVEAYYEYDATSLPRALLTKITMKDGAQLIIDHYCIHPNLGIHFYSSKVYDSKGNSISYGFSLVPSTLKLRVNSVTDTVGRSFSIEYSSSGDFTNLKQNLNIGGQRRIYSRTGSGYDTFTDALGRVKSYWYGTYNSEIEINQIDYPNGNRTNFTYQYDNVMYSPSSGTYRVAEQKLYKPGGTIVRTITYGQTVANAGPLATPTGYGPTPTGPIATPTPTPACPTPTPWENKVTVDDGIKRTVYTLTGIYNPLRGYTEKEQTYDMSGHLMKEVTTTYERVNEYARPITVTTKMAKSNHTLGEGAAYYYRYDDWGNTTYIKDPSGCITRMAYSQASSSGNPSSQSNLSAHNTEDGIPSPATYYDYIYTFPNIDIHDRLLTKATLNKNPVNNNHLMTQTHYKYDNEGNMIEESVLKTNSPSYRVTRYTYDDWGNMLSQIDPQGNELDFVYGGVNYSENPAYLIRVYNPDGNDDGVKNDPVNLATYTYDFDLGKPLVVKDPNGCQPGSTQHFDYTYDILGRMTRETLDGVSGDAKNIAVSKVIIYHDAPGDAVADNIVDIQYGNDFSGGWQYGRITYDWLCAKPLKVERKLGGVWTTQKTNTYDSKGRLQTAADNLGAITQFEYDALDRQAGIIYPNNTETRFAWDDHTLTTTDPNGNIKKQYYDVLDRVIKVEEHPDSWTTYTTLYAYDSAGHLIQITNDRGVLSTNTYDNLGQLVRVDYPQDGANPMAPERYEYDAAGNLWKKTTALGTKMMEYEFNSGYRVKKVTEADGRVIDFIYDANDNLLKQSTTGVTYTYSNYDARNRAHNFTATLDGRSFNFSYDYDAFGRVTGITYPNRTEEVAYTYDELDRLLSIPGFVNSCSYDGDNKLSSMTFGNGVNTKYSYDINGRLAVMGADQQVGTAVEAEEMTLGNYVVEPNGSASNGSLIKCPSGQGTASYQYTGASGSYALKVIYYDESDGASTFKIRRNGVTIDQWTADRDMGTEEATSRNRLSRVKEAVDLNPGDTITLEGTTSGGENARLDRLKIIPQSQYLYNLDYEYDPNGNITRIGEDYYNYDGLNRLVWAGNTQAAPMISASPNPCIIPSGQSTGSVTISCNPPTSQFEVRVSIDGAPEIVFSGSLSKVANWIQAGKTYVFTLYDCSNINNPEDPDVINDSLGSVIPPQHDKGVRLDSVTVTARQGYMSANPNPCIIPSGQNTASVTIHCNPPVSRFQVWVSINGGAELLMSGAAQTSFVHWIKANSTYTFILYDFTGGVKGAKLDSITVTGISSTGEELGRKGTAWEYDCAGNMTRIEQYIGGQMHAFQDLEYDLANRLWKKCRVSYENDANGNRTSRTLDSKVLNYQYDGENRLTQVTKNGVDVLDNMYDGAGMRIKEVKGGQTTYFVYQGNNPLMEYTPGDGKYKYFIYAGNKRIAEETDGVVKYYYQDHLGSTRVVTDGSGNKVAEYRFRPYGEKDSSTGTFSTDYQFTGKLEVDEVGLSYFGARFYDPEVGRFLSLDPGRQGLNWYSYCANNPLKYVDPDGRAYELTKTWASTGWIACAVDGPLPVGEVVYVGGIIVLAVGETWATYGNRIVQVIKLYEYTKVAIDTTYNIYEKSSSRILGANLTKAGYVRGANEAAHHIVAGNAPNAAIAREVLHNFGIGINDAGNGIFLDSSHYSIHTNKYYDEVNRLLGQADTKEEALAILRQIAEDIKDGIFPH